MNNVPPTALAQIIIPAQRKELASSFKAGNTPDWYQSLPTDVKSYLSVVKTQLREGALTATHAAATQTPTPVTTGEGGAAASTSSEGTAARPTGAGVLVSGMGALGVLGVALVL